MPDPTAAIEANHPAAKLTCDQLVQLLAAMVAVAHDPVRFTDAELDLAFRSWNDLLTATPDVHRRRPEFFAFHQALLLERDFRDAQADQEAAA